MSSAKSSNRGLKREAVFQADVNHHATAHVLPFRVPFQFNHAADPVNRAAASVEFDLRAKGRPSFGQLQQNGHVLVYPAGIYDK